MQKVDFTSKLQATIYVHTTHTGHQPCSDADSFFLPVHPYVLSWATENLKYMYSTAAVALASERDQELFRQNVGELERITYRFHMIRTEVQALAYSMRINGKFSIIISLNCVKKYLIIYSYCSLHFIYISYIFYRFFTQK